ncbi:unnamed protein product [Onchocerca flexuosa]|uniref:Photosystem II reaction center protein PsbH n=1 Tax=Onchocerca flexuosa TaxID=387005 RepID=A0A183HW81_9BILA|nr:unnamed protein product [Onchocerca flexuosa]
MKVRGNILWEFGFYPTWLAPNVLTLTGFMFVTFAFFVVSYYDYYVGVNSKILAENSGKAFFNVHF